MKQAHAVIRAGCNRTRMLIWLALVLALTGCEAPPELTGPHETALRGLAIGTQYNLKVVTEEPISTEARETLQAEVDARLDRVDSKMSTYQPDSELSRFNDHASAEPFEVSSQTLTVFRKSLKVSERSNGAFDITVGPLVKLWGFGPGREDAELPPPEDEIAAALERTGYQHLQIDEEASTISKSVPDLYCDLGGVAKGYAADYVAEGLEELGYGRFMVEIGGDITARGLNRNDVPWRLAVEKPDPETREPYVIVNLRDAALCTSGDYRNFFEHEGVVYSHTINPNTGWPVSHDLVSVSVIHDSCTLADAWATAIMALGPEKGAQLAEQEGLAALLLVRDNEGEISEIATGDIEAHLERIS